MTEADPDSPPPQDIVLATEFAAEPEPENNEASYYGIGAAAFTTIAAAAYLYSKRQQKSQSDSFMRV